MKPALPLVITLLSPSVVSAGMNYIDYQSACRRGVMERAHNASEKWFSPIQSHDRAEDLIDEPTKIVKSLKAMEEQKLLSGQTAQQPWSDSYWPLSKGGLGQRYVDDKVMGMDFKEAMDYVTAEAPEKLMQEGRWAELSPAEKYDSLMGLKNYPLTEASWLDGKEYYDRYGSVESWMGLCHGWAAVSMMMPEPKKRVEVMTEEGVKVFNPSDIKGLGTLLWAKGNFQTKFIGGRCNSKDPRTDSAGRPTESDCLDNNPGTWHLVVVNQVGASKRSFIMDASQSYEVWNHPVSSYEYRYYHPKTKKRSLKLESAIAERGQFEDGRSKYRARETKYVVGIVMRVTYGVENFPSDQEDQPILDSVVEYEYDLELDANHKIIGGEWYSYTHPDFLWGPVKRSFPQSYGDNGQDELNFVNLSAQVKQVAAYNANQGLPWGPVVRHLFKKSSR
jgi:hypothetical protein